MACGHDDSTINIVLVLLFLWVMARYLCLGQCLCLRKKCLDSITGTLFVQVIQSVISFPANLVDRRRHRQSITVTTLHSTDLRRRRPSLASCAVRRASRSSDHTRWSWFRRAWSSQSRAAVLRATPSTGARRRTRSPYTGTAVQTYRSTAPNLIHSA